MEERIRDEKDRITDGAEKSRMAADENYQG